VPPRGLPEDIFDGTAKNRCSLLHVASRHVKCSWPFEFTVQLLKCVQVREETVVEGADQRVCRELSVLHCLGRSLEAGYSAALLLQVHEAPTDRLEPHGCPENTLLLGINAWGCHRVRGIIRNRRVGAARSCSMSVNVTVSVVVPTRNRPELLRVSLEAIARQAAQTVELVVIDDGSTAECARWNEQFTRNGFEHATYHHVDSAGAGGGGPSFARNVGIKLAQGRFIAFCDDDDYWLNTKHLSECVSLFEQDPELDFVFANQESRHDGKVATMKSTAKLPKKLGLVAGSSGNSFLLSKEDCLLGWFPHMNTCVFRRELLDKIGGFWATSCWEDLDLYVRAVDAARRVRYLDRTVAVHNNAASSRLESVTALLNAPNVAVCASNVASHLIYCLRSEAAIRYARRLGGEAYRLLALDAHRRADRVRASAFAQLGLAARFSLKWALVTLFFTLRGWI
jgi:glycosyltransferase involved in cell wall biosynthesis